MEKKFTRNGKTLVFYQKSEDDKFSFFIENEPKLTELLLSQVKTKRVKIKDIHYAVDGIFEKIEQGLLRHENLEEMENPIVGLSELCQKKYRENIITEVLGSTGPSHCPVITVRITLPNQDYYEASGINQREAKKAAARKALENLA